MFRNFPKENNSGRRVKKNGIRLLYDETCFEFLKKLRMEYQSPEKYTLVVLTLRRHNGHKQFLEPERCRFNPTLPILP